MPFERPGLSTIISRISADLESRFEGADAGLRRSVLNAMAKTLSGAVHGVYGYLDFLALQLMPDTSEQEYMERWGRIWGITRKAATLATGEVTFTGTDNAVILAGTLLQRSDGEEFETSDEGTISSGTVTVGISSVNAGSDGNTDGGLTLTLVSPITGVDSDGTIETDGITGGTDEEGDDDLLGRLLARIQQPPHGGAIFDYETWALEVEGVTRAWAYAEYLGIGTVGVTFVMDDQVGSIIPDAPMVQTVQDYIDYLRPVTAELIVFAPTAVELDFTIQLTPDTSAVRSVIEAELEDLLRRESEPGGTILISHIREAISTAAGETDHVLSSPTANVAHETSEIAIMGTITWQ